jgi:aminoglycoside phosphotransferase (APT) family kinase protein
VPEPAAELSLTAEDVDRLLAEQHPAHRGPLRSVAHGWDNEVFRLGDDLAVRLPRRAAAAALIEHEQRWLPVLAPQLPVPVPVPVAVGQPDAAYPWRWSIVPWFDGIRLLDLPVDERDALAGEVATFLRRLHTPAPVDAPHNPVRGVPLRDRDDAVHDRLQAFPELMAVWRAAVDVDEWRRPAVWVHGDVHPGNVVVRDGHLAAVIDFGDMCAGDPACDLAIAWTGFSRAARARFREALGDTYDEATWARSRGWAALFATILHDADDAGHRAMSAHAMRQLLDDPV